MKTQRPNKLNILRKYEWVSLLVSVTAGGPVSPRGHM